MASIPHQPKRASGGVVRFGAFELDTDTGELRKLGKLISLQDQQAVVLKYLVERAATVVTREELRAQIWPEGTYVEFEAGLYNTINRLRRSLGDSASNPHFIETVPKEGYRFIASVEHPPGAAPELISSVAVTAERAEIRSEGANQSPITESRSVIPWWPFLACVAIGLLLLGGILGALLRRVRSGRFPKAQVYRYAIPVSGVEGISSLAISPGGDEIVFEGANRTLWRRYLDRIDPRPIRGSEGGTAPFFSPDGQSVGFFAGNLLKVAENDRVRTLAVLPVDYPIIDAGWGQDGFVYFNTRIGEAEGIWRISSRGGKQELIVPAIHSGRGQVLPLINQVTTRPRHLLIYSTNSGPIRRSLRVRDLETHLDRLVVEHGVGGYLLSDGELVYYSRGSLFAVAFDPNTLQPRGAPVETVKNVNSLSWQSGLTSVSNNGSLAYVARGDPELNVLQWIDGNGQITPVSLPADQYEQAEVSPHGNMLAIVRTDAVERSSLWTYDLRNTAWHHVMNSEVPHLRAQWSPDETALVVSSARQNEDFTNLYRVPLANPGDLQRLTEEPDYGQFPLSWSAKANAILYMEGVHQRTDGDIMVLSLGNKANSKSLIATRGWDRSASFSPDGRWLIYESNDLGPPEIFIRRYSPENAAALGSPIKVSLDGGTDPIWVPDGRSVYYSDLSRRLMQVALSRDGVPTQTRSIGVLVPGWKDYWTRTCSIAPDGRLLFIRSIERTRKPAEIQVIINWAAEIERLSPVP